MKTLKSLILILMTLSFFPVSGQNLPPFTSPDSDTLTWTDTQGVHLLLLEQSELFTDEESDFKELPKIFQDFAMEYLFENYEYNY